MKIKSNIRIYMPYKVTFGKKKKKQFNRPNMFKKKQSNKVMFNRMPKRVHNIVAPSFFTTMQAQAQVRIEIGEATVNVFQVLATRLNKPFNSLAPLSNISTGLGSVLTDDIQPAGFIPLTNLYENYRVNKCTMRITVTPSAIADILLLIAIPQDTDTSSVNTAQQALSSPYSKTITCTGNNNIKQNTLTLGVKSRDYFGKTKQAFRSENDYACVEGMLGAPNTPLAYDIWYQLYSGNTNTASISVNVVLTYSIELFGPKTDLPI